VSHKNKQDVETHVLPEIWLVVIGSALWCAEVSDKTTSALPRPGVTSRFVEARRRVDEF